MKITYLGHSAFEIKTGEYKILVDPFLVHMPDYNYSRVSDIFVTHAHSDHLGSAIEISKETGAKITGIFELANYCTKFGARTNGIGLGARISYKWGRVSAVPAFHSSSFLDGSYGGCPCGYVFEIEGKTIYYAGDISLNSEMKAIGEFYEPDLAILPIGGTFTMDIEAAVKASEWLGVSAVIPMHYNTFGKITVNTNDFERQMREVSKIPMVMKIGASKEF